MREHSASSKGKGSTASTRGSRSVAPGKATRTAKIQRKASSRPRVQRSAAGASSMPASEPASVQETAAMGVSGSGAELPYLDAIQASFGSHDVSGVTAHTDGAAAQAAGAIGAQAYATGDSVAFADGGVSLHTAAHEAAHVVQQRAGVSLSGGVGQAGDAYERHADAVADRVAAGQSAQDLLDATPAGGAPAAQRAIQLRQNEAAAGTPRVRITATRLNVRSSPSSSGSDNVLGQLAQGTEIDSTGRQGDWLTIRYDGQDAFIHGGYVEPVAPATAGAGGGTSAGQSTPEGSATSDTGASTSDTSASDASTGTSVQGMYDSFLAWLRSLTGGPDAETRPPQNQPENGTSPQEPQEQDPSDGQAPAADPTPDNNAVLRLAHDFNNIPVWNAGESAPDSEPATHYRTPYLMNTVAECDEASQLKALVIQPGRPHEGQRVGQVARNAFIGKATPAQIQIVSQAVVDHGLATTANIQAYADHGRMRTASRRNGRWGVDCSGLTSQMMHELEGNGREGFESTNAASYLVGGSRGYQSVSPDQTRMGDVISYNEARHVVVIHDQREVQIPQAGNPEQTRGASKISVSEAAGSGRVLTDQRFFYFPGAARVMNRANPAGPTYTLGGGRTEELPTWQPQLAVVSYASSDTWVSNYTLFCSSDPGGTNIRVRGANGRFSSLSEKIPNGASGVELKEVEGDMVRVRYNGQDTRDGSEMWAPVRFVASAQAGYTVPAQTGFSAATYSVVRNPALEQDDDGGTDGND